MRIEVALVEWVDASIAPTSDYYKKDDPDCGLMHIVSVGQVVSDTDELIALATDNQSDGGHARRLEYPFRQVSMIPKACIRSIQRLTLRTGEDDSATAPVGSSEDHSSRNGSVPESLSPSVLSESAG